MKRFDYRTELKELTKEQLTERIDSLLDRVLDEADFGQQHSSTSALTKLSYAQDLFEKKFNE